MNSSKSAILLLYRFNLLKKLHTIIKKRIYGLLYLKRNKPSKIQAFYQIFFILTGKRIKYKKLYELSNYQVWIYKNSDKTTKYAIDGYHNMLDKLLLEVDHDSIFLDIGGNLGIFSLVASKNSKFKRIYCFEPHPKTFGILQLNIAVNYTKTVMPICGAVTNKLNQVLTDNNLHSGLNSLVSNKDSSKYNTVKINLINSTSLNQIVYSDIEPNSTYQFFVKIDTEGTELDVLFLLKECKFYNKISKIYLEIDLASNKENTIEKLLANDGFHEVHRFTYLKKSDVFLVR